MRAGTRVRIPPSPSLEVEEMGYDDLESNAVDPDPVESDVAVSVDVSPDVSSDAADFESSEAVQAPADSVESGEAETGARDPADAEAEETETADGVPAILQETEEVSDASDLIALLEVQHAETVAYMQNVQTLSLVGVVIFGVLVGCLVVNTIAGFFHNL